MKLLVLAALQLVNALSLYEYQCPHPSQWNLRSRILCESEQNRISYSCLYDEHNSTYIESCSENADFVRPGQKYVRFFQRSNVDCMKNRYQPIKFRSNLNSQCILLKSFCIELGQKIFSVGSTREDTKCYCDYEKGFLYITKPSHPCYCVPAEEDCSCYNECKVRKKSYGCFSDEQIGTMSECFRNLNDTIYTVTLTIQQQTDSIELRNYEDNDGYKLLQRKDYFHKILIVLSIWVACLGPIILVLTMFTCQDFSNQQKKDNHKPLDQYLVQIDMNEDIQANEQPKLCHLHKDNSEHHEEINRTEEIQANELPEIRQHAENRDLNEYVENGSQTCHTPHEKYLTDTGQNEEIPSIIIHEQQQSQPENEDFSEQRQNDNHKPSDQCIIQIDRKEDNHAYTQPHSQAAQRADISELGEYDNNKKCDQYRDEINRTEEIQANELPEIRQQTENRDLNEYVENGSHTCHKPHEKYLTDTEQNEEIPSIIIHEQQQSQPEIKVKSSTSQSMKKNNHFINGNSNPEREKSVNEIFIEKQSNLLQACIHGNLDKVRFLSQNGCNLNVKNDTGLTPLMLASLNGRIDVVNHLVQCGVNLNSRDNFGKTAIFYATQKLRLDVIKILITNNCDVNIANNSGVTPFVHSLKKECFPIADLLIKGGANIHEVNANDETALWTVCYRGKVAAVEYLIKLGFDVNKTNKNKQTVLWLACNNGRLEIVKILIKYGSDVNKSEMRSWSPLKAAASRGCAEICEYLLSHKADVNTADDEGWTPLMSSCREGHQLCAEILIKNEADCKLWNHQNKTALWLACRYAKESIVILLLSKSDINKCDHKNRSPLDAASSRGHTDICNLLRSAGCKS